jgi:hypothetical protein
VLETVNPAITGETHRVDPLTLSIIPYSEAGRARKLQIRRPGFEWSPTTETWLDMRPLEQAKADAWSTIKRMREQAFAARAVSPNGVAYSITADKANLADRLASLDAAISLGAATETTTIQWRDRDNVAHEISITGLRVLAAAMGARGQAIYEHSWALDAQVKAATSSGQLVAIDLEAGWP